MRGKNRGSDGENRRSEGEGATERPTYQYFDPDDFWRDHPHLIRQIQGPNGPREANRLPFRRPIDVSELGDLFDLADEPDPLPEAELHPPLPHRNSDDELDGTSADPAPSSPSDSDVIDLRTHAGLPRRRPVATDGATDDGLPSDGLPRRAPGSHLVDAKTPAEVQVVARVATELARLDEPAAELTMVEDLSDPVADEDDAQDEPKEIYDAAWLNRFIGEHLDANKDDDAVRFRGRLRRLRLQERAIRRSKRR